MFPLGLTVLTYVASNEIGETANCTTVVTIQGKKASILNLLLLLLYIYLFVCVCVCACVRCNYLVEKLPSCVICQVDRQVVKHFITNEDL